MPSTPHTALWGRIYYYEGTEAAQGRLNNFLGVTWPQLAAAHLYEEWAQHTQASLSHGPHGGGSQGGTATFGGKWDPYRHDGCRRVEHSQGAVCTAPGPDAAVPNLRLAGAE